jgi:hypothetical protein
MVHVAWVVAVGFLVASSAEALCTPNATHVCVTFDPFASEAGYYRFAGFPGVSPTINVTIGQTVTFDQSDVSNWFHPLGFAYAPDGAHGATWGGEEQPEIEGAGELQYLIDGAPPTCPDSGNTGLDCYEPEFFYPRAEWRSKKYTVQLTVTPAVAAASNGGVLYYFCHIHSKMSGKIQVLNTDGTLYNNSRPELPLYSPAVLPAFDATCGTFGVSPYAPDGPSACSEKFLLGSIDTDFERCMQAIDCMMMKGMMVSGFDSHGSEVTTFMQQMIPHHQNGVNMAKILLKLGSPSDIACALDDCSGAVPSEGELNDLLWDIINGQVRFQHRQPL